MAFLDATTRVIRTVDKSASILIKDTVTVEDIVFLYARTAAVNKKSSATRAPFMSDNIRKQITRVPYVR
jgi:hypothetical protein